jgi:hypothetical protein
MSSKMTDSRHQRKSPWIRTIIFNVVLIGISLIFAGILGEIAVRIAAPQQLIIARPDLWQSADTVGWLRRPNIDGSVNTGEGAIRLIADADGFRVGKRGRVDGLPILFLGDSFIEALQVEYEQTVTHLLESELPARIGQPVAVRNAGVGGYGPSHYYLRARSLLPRDKYRVVVTAIFAGNDAQPRRFDYFPPRNAEQRRFRLPRRFDKAEYVDAVLGPTNDFLEERSHLYVMTRKRLDNVRMKVGLHPLDFPREFMRSEQTSQRWDVTADICHDIRELAKRSGARALFVLIPTDFQVDEATFTAYVNGFGIDPTAVDLDQPIRRLLEEFAERDLDVVNALPKFRELSDAGKVLYGDIDPHLSPEGHRALADLLLPEVSRLLRTQQTSVLTKSSLQSNKR